MEINIGKKKIGNNEPVFIIAEAGVNHNGNLKLAKKLVDAALKAGADAVKFQTFQTENLIRKNAPKAEYQNRNIGFKKSQFKMLKELELKEVETIELKKYCDRRGIVFLSTPYDVDSLAILKKIGVTAYKIASIDIVHHPLLEEIAPMDRPVILSTGMATESEIREAVKVFSSKAIGRGNLILLQCNTNYPAELADQNLRALSILKKYTPIVGYSDHTAGSESSIAAVALGAKVIERHLTLDKAMRGPDHKASLNPKEFSNFVRLIRNTELALGRQKKEPYGQELENISAMRRSICAKNEIPAGATLLKTMFAYKRPGTGLYPTAANIKRLVGKKTRNIISVDENITLDKII